MVSLDELPLTSTTFSFLFLIFLMCGSFPTITIQLGPVTTTINLYRRLAMAIATSKLPCMWAPTCSCRCAAIQRESMECFFIYHSIALGIFGHSLQRGRSTLVLVFAVTLFNFNDWLKLLHHRFFELGPWRNTSLRLSITSCRVPFI